MRTAENRITACGGLIVSILLSSCASQIIPTRMGAMIGQRASIAIAKLGYPTDQREIAGQKVYIWSTNRYVNGTSFGCTIRVIVDSDEIIKSSDAEGSEGGCAQFALQLSQ